MSKALTITETGDGVRLVFSGPLVMTAVPSLWTQSITAAGQARGEFIVDLERMDRCDGGGVGLLTEIDRVAREAGAAVTIVGASDELGELLTMARIDPASVAAPPRRAGFITEVGNATAGLLATTRDLVAFTGDLTMAIPRGIATLRGPRLAEVVRNCARVGADAVPVVSLLGALVGFILAVQAVRALEKIGGSSLVPMVVGFATLREFGALIAAIILAGRSGSAFAAELGTMKVTEELDAYTTFGLDPMVILVFPRLVAGTLVMPLLALFSILCGVVGGVVPMLAEGYTFAGYVDSVVEAVAFPDLMQAMVKATVFGFIVSALGCFHGLRTGRGADAVGLSATKAVVAGIVAVLVADSVLSAIFYNLGY